MDTSVGLILIVLGIALLILEATEPGFFIAIPAGVLFVLGVISVIYPSILFTWWTPMIVAAVVIPMMIVSMKFYQGISPPSKPTTTMGSSLVGEVGKVMVRVVPDEISGKVKLKNQIWSATSQVPIPQGSKVVVTKSEGVVVWVKKLKESEET
ncbi:MAG: NfeD family protein [Thermoplasmata archaeon]